MGWRQLGPALFQPADRNRSRSPGSRFRSTEAPRLRVRWADSNWASWMSILGHFGPNPWANYAVLRVKRSLWGTGSYIGVMGIDKRSGNPPDCFQPDRGCGRQIGAVQRTWSSTAMPPRLARPAIPSGRPNLGAGMNLPFQLARAFRRNTGRLARTSIPRSDFWNAPTASATSLDATFKTRPKHSGASGNFKFEGFIFHAPDTHHVVQTQEWQTTFRADFHNGSYTDDDIVDVFTQRLTAPFNIYKNVNIPVGVYNWTRHQITYGTPQDRRLTVQLLRALRKLLQRTTERSPGPGHLSRQRTAVVRLGDQWNRFRLPLPDGNFSVLVGSSRPTTRSPDFLRFHASPDGHGEHASGQREYPVTLELPAG